MRPFQSFVSELRHLVTQAGEGFAEGFPEAAVLNALNGAPSKALNRLVSRTELRDSGVFFTGSEFAQRAARRVVATITPDAMILDPACGAGDLLIACSTALQTSPNLTATLNEWSQRLVGRDLFMEFVEATKLRLILSAAQTQRVSGEHYLGAVLHSASHFPLIRQHCGLGDAEAITAATHIVMNPPFALVDAPDGCKWASGKVNAAALFVDTCLEHARLGTQIVAILPDVLRSGSRYKEWRDSVERRASIREIELWGQFDTDVDVDVFLLHLEAGSSSPTRSWLEAGDAQSRTVSDLFEVSVGPVVDYRDPHEGQIYPFVRPRGLAKWETVTEVQEQRLFSRRAIEPPFVVVRRTSRPGDTHRAVATIIDTRSPVAVENHMIVLRPRSGNRAHCQDLMRLLRTSEASAWLDERIRCRHLTVSALEELPWVENLDA